MQGKLDTVQCLIGLGASIEAVDCEGDTALLCAASKVQCSTMKCLLEHAGANFESVNNAGKTIWDLLMDYQYHHLEAYDELYSPVALPAILRVMVLRGDPPPTLMKFLSPENARLVEEGARLRARLPAYFMQLLDTHCPVLLPPLQALVCGYVNVTTEEAWATGLGQAP
jgi:hypothetical protein